MGVSNAVGGKGGIVSLTVTVKPPGGEKKEYQMTGTTDLSEEEFNEVLKEIENGDTLNSGS